MLDYNWFCMSIMQFSASLANKFKLQFLKFYGKSSVYNHPVYMYSQLCVLSSKVGTSFFFFFNLVSLHWLKPQVHSIRQVERTCLMIYLMLWRKHSGFSPSIMQLIGHPWIQVFWLLNPCLLPTHEEWCVMLNVVYWNFSIH